MIDALFRYTLLQPLRPGILASSRGRRARACEGLARRGRDDAFAGTCFTQRRGRRRHGWIH